MKYLSLYKKSFMSDYDANKEYIKLFNSASTIKFDIVNNDYPFFVNINNEITKLIEEIHALNSKVIKITYANRRLPELVVGWNITHTLIEEIRMSNEIEGVASTRKEIKDILDGHVPTGYKRLYGLVSKYQQLLEDSNLMDILTCKDVRDLYDKTMYKDIEKENARNLPDGEIFRKEAVDVLSSGQVIHNGLNSESNIINTMEKVLQILNDKDISLLVRVAVFHYLFGYIHPFYDGNGRMSRLISTAYLKKELDTLSALQLSISCKSERKKYYEIFKVTNDIRNKGDLTYFVISFLEIIKNGLLHLLESTEEKINQYIYYEKHIQELNELDKNANIILMVLLQASLFIAESLSVSDIMKFCDLSSSTVRNKLATLESKGLVKYITEEHKRKYLLDLNALSQQ